MAINLIAFLVVSFLNISKIGKRKREITIQMKDRVVPLRPLNIDFEKPYKRKEDVFINKLSFESCEMPFENF